MKMKASVLKKLNLIIEEGNSFKNRNEFQKAIKKFNEAINFINSKVTAPEDKNTEIANIKNAINQTYSVEINNVIQEAIGLTAQKEFDKAKEIIQKAMKITNIIDDLDLKDAEKLEIKKLMSKNEIEQLLDAGTKSREEENFDEAIEIFNKGIKIAETIHDPDYRIKQLSIIKKEIKQTQDTIVKIMVEQGTRLKQSGQTSESIEAFQNALELIEKHFDPDSKRTEITNIKNLSNEIYSNQIKPIVENGKELIKQNLVEKGISELKNALDMAKKMYDSDLKNLEISLIAEALNPIYIERIRPIVEKGKNVIKQEKFEESITTIKEAVDIFGQALDIANAMVMSSSKEKELKEISDFINQICLKGINVIKDNSIQLIVQKKYDEAISEIYTALSIAKLMAIPEEENEEIENLKNLVNKVYSAEIKEVVSRGNKLVDQKEYEKAIDVYNDALNMTNKMYLTDEMEGEVNEIKSLIYQTEIKQIVGKGKLSEETKLKEKEIEKLQKRLEYANSIEDKKRRIEEINKIKKQIDEVHSKEIKLLIEQGNELAEKRLYKEAFGFYERALKVDEMMEEPDVRNKGLIKDTYKRELINKAKLEIENNQFDAAIETCNRATELDNNFIQAYYQIGIAYNYKKKFESAIQNFEKVVGLKKDHIDSWNNMGFAHEHLNNLEEAKQSYEKALEINHKNVIAIYNLANVYKQQKQYDEAIENYKKATLIDPEFAKAWFYMGSAYIDKKDYDIGVKHLENAIKLDPNLAQEVRSHIKNFKETIDRLRESLSLSFINR